MKTSQVTTTAGVYVGDFAASAISDIDVANLKGIAITDAPNIGGLWQYSTDGVSWANIGAVSPTNARLLGVNSFIRFFPSTNAGSNQTISFRAWDQTSGTVGILANVSVNGGATSFSTQLATATINIPQDLTTNNATLSAELIALLRNPPAPDTPAPVIVGFPFDPSLFDVLPETPSEFGNLPPDISLFGRLPETPSLFGNLPDDKSNKLMANDDCPSEILVKQQPRNPVSETIWGTNKKDVLEGTATVNTVRGLQGRDSIFGTPDQDNLYGGKGNDLIFGFGKRDYIKGGAGNDQIFGGGGADVIFGDKGQDVIHGDGGNDFISGGNGKDTIYGDRGNDVIAGGKGKDRLFGGAGNDYICGCEGDDLLRGGKGNDVLNGGKGKDLLIGGFGNDILTGGPGRDRFRIAPGTGTDTITDFTVGKDTIQLSKGLKLSDLQITQGVGATVIGLQPGTIFPSDKPLALLTGVNASSLTPNSFITL